MERLRGFRRNFRFPWRSSAQVRRDVDDEIAFHLAAKTERLQREGLSFEEAREEALRQFGDVEGARERLVADGRRGERIVRNIMMLDDLVRDARIAMRSLRRTPSFTAVAVLVLALGIGVVSGAFNLINVVALKPALIDEPERVRSVYAVHTERRNGRLFAYPEYLQLREQVAAFSEIAAYTVADVGVEEGGLTQRVEAAFVSANYFQTLGVPPARGRGFTLAEERGDEPGSVVVSQGFWIRNGADPNLLGSVLRVNGEALVVVGIAPRGFTGTMALAGADLWVSLAALERVGASRVGDASNLRDPSQRSLFLFGRLDNRASAAEAAGELAALAMRIDENTADGSGGRYTYIHDKMARFSMSTAPNPDDNVDREIFLPFAMSAVVLLIACLNLANMFLARGASRRTELAIRQSLGSGRARLVRQLMTEGLLLALLGGAVGLLWTYWATSWLAASLAKVVPLGLTLVVDTRPDLRVLLATGAACVAAVLLFGLLPAWRVTGTDVLRGLKESAGAVPIGRRRPRMRLSGRSLLMVAQIALSLVMLTAGGLFMRSALAAANATPSFDLDATLRVALDPRLVGNDETRSRALYAAVMERLRALPEVEHAGMASTVPFGGITRDQWVQPAGSARGESASFAHVTVIGDGYFAALRLPIFRGRDFTPAEATAAGGSRTAIIDEPLARRLFPDSDALGRQIQLPSSDPDAEPTVMQIVGVAPGTPGGGFDPAPEPHLYLPFGESFTASMNVLIAIGDRAANNTSMLDTIGNAIREIDPSLPVLSLTTMRELRDENLFLWFSRVGGQLFTLLGVLALFMAMVGLYGVKSFLMSRRTREIGVRMALGATRGNVLRQMMRESMALTVAGLAVGLVLALAVGQILSSMLYEVSAADPWVLLGASAVLALAAAVASWLPVRSALRIDPSVALRHE